MILDDRVIALIIIRPGKCQDGSGQGQGNHI